MDRSLYLDIEASSSRRTLAVPFEMREGEGDTLVFEGHASVTEHEYPVFGGTYPGWMETIATGAFKRTLRAKADVAFLLNHDGMTLARTKSKTMTLDEDSRGLHTVATLDPDNSVVSDLRSAVERGDVDEMSFAFRVVKDEWFDDDGEKSNSLEGTKRRITEINLHKGDVSAVNYGANDAASGGFRLDAALAELRSGRLPSAEQRALIRSLVDEPEARDDEETPEQAEEQKALAEAIAHFNGRELDRKTAA